MHTRRSRQACSIDWIFLERITEDFGDLIEAQNLDLGPDDLFPSPMSPTDAEPALVHLYSHFDVIVPAGRMQAMDRYEAVQKGKDICTVLYDSCGELEQAY